MRGFVEWGRITPEPPACGHHPTKGLQEKVFVLPVANWRKRVVICRRCAGRIRDMVQAGTGDV